MAFNNFNNPRQMFPTQNQGNFSGMQSSGQAMGGFQPNQGFAPQQSQGFPGSFPGYQMGQPMGPQMGLGPQMNPQMRPQMGPQMQPQMGPQIGPQRGSQMGPQMNTQKGLQIGTFPSNVQLGHQFPKQQQKMIDRQRKHAEEQLKKQEELMKKKQFEAEKRKLQQSFSAKKPSNADAALNSLFGKNKTGGSSMTDLIGSLGSVSTAKPAASKASSVFSRPGGSAAHQSNFTPGQWGSGYMTSGLMPPQGGPASAPSQQMHGDVDDFGDFSQGPSVPDQGDFSDFQGAQPSTQFGGGSFPAMGSSAPVPTGVSGGTSVFSQTQAWHGALSAPSSSTGAQHSFPQTQNTSGTLSIHGVHRQDHMTSSGSASASSVTQRDHMSQFSGDTSQPQTGSSITGIHPQGGQMTHFTGDPSRPQAGSIPGMSMQGGQMAHFMGEPSRAQTDSMLVMTTQGGQMTHFMDETSKNRAGSISEMMSSAGGNVPSAGVMSQPSAPHLQQMGNQGVSNFPMGVPPPTMGPQGGGFGLGPSHPGTVPVPSQDQPSMPAAPTEPLQEPVAEVEDSPERKLELLYGVSLPDWCVNGTDLPGVYKEIAEKTSDSTDVIDTNRLFPILMASDLPRDQLGHIWNRANRAVPGQLNTLELRIVLGLVALAQAGMKTERLTLEKLASCKAAPIPTIPESVLQTRGRGWSFTEPSQEGPQTSGMLEGNSPRGRHSSTSSDHSIDPNDKYSVFRAVDQPEENSITNSPSVDSKDRFGAFQSGDQLVMKALSQPSQVPLFQGGVSQPSSGWNRTEAGSIPVGGSNPPNQQQNFGHFQSLQSVAAHGTNEQNEFGDFQEQTGFSNRLISGPPNLGNNLSQDDFGDFQSEVALHGSGTKSAANQKPSQAKDPDFNNLQTGNDWSAGTSPALKPFEVAATKLQEDDFGDFQGGKESETGSVASSSVTTPKQHEHVQSLQGFGNFQIGGKLDNKAKSSEVAGVDLFSKAVNNTTTKSVGNVDTSSVTEVDDFGDFQHSPGPFSTSDKGFSSFSSGGSEKLVSSLEKFKLSNDNLSSAQGEVKTPSLPGNKGLVNSLTNEKQPRDTMKQNAFADFAAFENGASPPSSQTKTSEDKYSAFRDADFGSGRGLFNVSNPATTGNQISDDGFADFGGFEVADQFKSVEDNDFGAFKSTENVQSVSFGVTDDSQPAQQNLKQDFGDFNSSGSTNLSTPQPEKDSSSGFGAFGSFVAGSSAMRSNQPHPTSNASDSLINSVSLEPTERYKVLSHDSGDMDQHAHAWSRCLNSCLLTLATATLAIQKIGEQSVKEEVLESKEGATYFSAIVEIYRVTLRIKASVNKSAPNNTKLKDIHQEIERTWKDISSFLSGSDILPSRSSLDFTLHHVSSTEDGSVACGICLLNVNKSTSGASKQCDGKLMYGGRQYHSTCANFWCNRVDSVLPSLLPINSLI